ncbi:MAG: hypothetical protein R3C26_00110 [Calditrichia bacterium]
MSADAQSGVHGKFRRKLAQLVVLHLHRRLSYPAVACKVLDLVGAKNAGGFDIMANCTGFQVGLGVVSDRMLADSSVEYGAVIGTALQSRYINWNDPDSAIYFGDGAGAAILGKVPGVTASSRTSFTNAKVYDSVRLRGGGSFPMRLKT